MLVPNKPSELEAATQAHSTSPKTQRWGSIKQRLSMNNRGGVDDEMWDKNDAAFLQEVARDSPIICADAFDDTLMPLEAGYVRSPSFSSPRLSADHLYRANTARPSSSNTSASTSSASTASSGHDDLISSKGWIKNVKRRGSTAAAAGGSLPDLPEQPRPESDHLADVLHAAIDSTTEPSGQLLSSPIHVADRNSFRYSPASSQGDGGEVATSARPLVADQYPRSPSLYGSPSPSAPSVAFRPYWEDRSHETRGRTDGTKSSPAHFVEVRMVSGALAGAAAPVPSHTSAALLEAIEDDRLSSSPRSPYAAATVQGPASPERAQRPCVPTTRNRRRSLASLLASPQIKETRSIDATDALPSGNEQEEVAEAGPSTVRKHQRSGSSLVAGLKKLMGRRDRERELRADSSFNSSTTATGEAFCHPSSSSQGRHVADDVQVVGRMPLLGNEEVRGLNLVGVPLSISSPLELNETSPQKTIRAARRSPSVDILRSLAGLGLAHAVSDAAQAPFPSTSPPADDAIAARSRTKSSDGLGQPFRKSFSQRIRIQSSVGHALSRAQARASIIEHISFDEAQRITDSSGPILLQSNESLEELRSQKDGHVLDGELVTPVLSPVRPRRPSSPQYSRFSVDTCITAGTGGSANGAHTFDAHPRSAPSCFGFQPQIYKPPNRDYLSGRMTPSSPSMHSFGSHHTDSSSNDGPSHAHLSSSSRAASGSNADGNRLAHASRRSLSSLGSRPWSNLLASPILSGSSSFSQHKRLSTASISRPFSVVSSAFSDPNEIGADMQDLPTLLDSRNRFDSNASEPMLSYVYPAPLRPNQQAVRSRRIARDSRRPMKSGSMSPNSPASTARLESPLQRSSSVKAFHSGKSSRAALSPEEADGAADDHDGNEHGPTLSSHDALRDLRKMSTASFARRKRPSFGLAIEPAASSAFDSIPSPLLRTRRPSTTDVDIEQPIRPRPGPSGNDDETDLELLRDQPAPSIPEAVVAMDGPGHFGRAPYEAAAAVDAHSFERYRIHSVDEEGNRSGRLNQATKDLAFGSIAGMFSKVFEHPFDLVKVRLQTQVSDQPPRYKGAFDCFRQTYVGEGVRGLYRGISMPVVGATLENACLFFTYNRIQSLIRTYTGQQSASGSSILADAESPLSFPQLAIAAAGAGSVTSLVLTPIELIKCKMQVQMITRQAPMSGIAAAAAATAAASMGQAQTGNALAAGLEQRRKISLAPGMPPLDGPLTLLRRTIQTDGVRGLWLGQTGTLLRETGGGVAWFLAFESCSRWFIERKKALRLRDDISKRDLTSLELVSAGALAGISYNVVLFPADSVKSTMQTELEMRAPLKPGEPARPKTGFFQTFKNIYRTRGVKGLYAGCGVTCLRSAPSSALIFLMVNKLEQAADFYGI